MNIISLSTIVLLIIYCAYLKSKINRLLREDTPVADYTNNRQITAIQEEKISKKEQIAQKNDTTNYTSNTLNTLHLQTKEYGISSFKKATLIVGMRTPGTFDNYQDKGKKQFETECRNNSISIDNYVNICHLLPVLDMRNYHIELIKDGLETYSNEDNQYIGSHEWQKKWSKIIFSSKISSKEFCDCIRAIMAAHNFTERDNSIDNSITLDGKIKEKESFFIFRALHIMHYNIKIRTYSLEYEKLNVNNSKILEESESDKMSFMWNCTNSYFKKEIKEIALLLTGATSLIDSRIHLEKSYNGLVFSKDIINGKSSFFYSGATFESNCIHSGYLVMTKEEPFIINKWKQDNCLLTKGIIGIKIIDSESISNDYLFLFMRLILWSINRNEDNINISQLHSRELGMLTIAYPSRIEQSLIIHTFATFNYDTERIIEFFSQNKKYNTIIQTIKDNSIVLANTQQEQSNGIKIERSIPSTVYTSYSTYKSGSTYVKGHYRKGGTYVQGHFRHK